MAGERGLGTLLPAPAPATAVNATDGGDTAALLAAVGAVGRRAPRGALALSELPPYPLLPTALPPIVVGEAAGGESLAPPLAAPAPAPALPPPPPIVALGSSMIRVSASYSQNSLLMVAN